MKLATSSPSEEGHETINFAVCFKRGNGVNNIASVSQVDDRTELTFCWWNSGCFEHPGVPNPQPPLLFLGDVLWPLGARQCCATNISIHFFNILF